MEYITLNNGVKMPTEGIGTFLLTPDEAESAVVSALHSGATLIDTANAYVNEKAVGRAMKASGLQREEIFLETKLWPSFYKDADAIDKTLARLDTDYIDLLLIHQTSPQAIMSPGIARWKKPTKRGKSGPLACPISTLNRWKKSSPSARCSPQFCRPRFTLTTKSRNSRHI